MWNHRRPQYAVLTLADSSDLSCCIESDDDSFFSVSVNYSAECSDDHSIPDISVSAEMEVWPYRFEPEVSDSESVDHGEEAHTDDSSLEQVGNNHW